MSKQMKSDSIETVGKRLAEIRRRLRHVKSPCSTPCYDNQVFLTNVIDDMYFLLALVSEKKMGGGGEK